MRDRPRERKCAKKRGCFQSAHLFSKRGKYLFRLGWPVRSLRCGAKTTGRESYGWNIAEDQSRGMATLDQSALPKRKLTAHQRTNRSHPFLPLSY
jgi:hypothetical protein